MITEKHISHYLILFLVLLFFLVAFYIFRYNEPMQTIVAALVCVFYIIWGIMHHAIEGRLTKLVALEYVLFGSLAFLIFFTVAYL